ncbi:MAG: hypothetical protein IKH64_04170 [Prevotella sp.]|nr:hypothetical protein [Prevotella sp.]
MRKYVLLSLFLLTVGATSVFAQKDLTGREYYNANIMAAEMNDIMKDTDKQLAEARAEAIAKGEKKLGRKLNQQELAMIDKKIKEGQEMMKAMKKGMKTAVTITFKSDKELVIKADMKMDEAVMKAAGIGWAKRKLLKAAMAVMPAQKGKYVVKGNTIYIDEGGNDRDTLYLSNDGKQLYGKMDNKKYTLNRVK